MNIEMSEDEIVALVKRREKQIDKSQDPLTHALFCIISDSLIDRIAGEAWMARNAR